VDGVLYLLGNSFLYGDWVWSDGGVCSNLGDGWSGVGGVVNAFGGLVIYCDKGVVI
jgi:hypothetical protein